MKQAGFEVLVLFVALPPYHYGLAGRKPGA
jgi:hypothetical protein